MEKQQFWKTVFNLALPVALQGVLYSLLAVVNQIMVGKLGSVAVVAVGLASKPQGILTFALFGLTGGLAILAAQYIGSQQEEKIAKIQGMMLAAGLFLTLIFILISLVFPEIAMRFFTTDSHVITQGVLYHRMLALSYFPFLLLQVYSTILRSAGIVRLPMVVSLGAVPLNAFLNYLLIFGNFGAPKLNIAGSALATTIATFIEAGVLLSFVYIKKLTGAFKARELLNFRYFDAEIKQLWKLSLPLLGDNLSFVLADTVGGAIFGLMGTNQTVAVTIMLPIQALIITFFAGFGTAASVMIGQNLGRDEFDFAYQTGKRILWLSWFSPLILGGILLLFMNNYLKIYELSSYSLHLTQLVLILMVIFVPVKVVNMVLGNVLSAGGETKFIFYISVLGGWLIGVPLGLLTAFVLHLPIDLVFVAITLEEVVRLGLGIWKLRTRTWLRNLVR